MRRVILVLLNIFLVIALKPRDCKYIYRIEKLHHPYKFTYELDKASNITICYTVPNTEQFPQVNIVFDGLQSIWNSGEKKVKINETADNSTRMYAIVNISRPCQRGRMWRHLDNEPGALDSTVVITMVPGHTTTKIDVFCIVLGWVVGPFIAYYVVYNKNSPFNVNHGKKE